LPYQSFREYVQGTAKIGIGLGVLSILARWVTGITIFASPEALMKYGIFGGIGYSMMGAFAMMAFGWLGRRVRSQFPDGLTIGDYFQYKLNKPGYWLMIALLLLISVEGMFMQGMAAGVLLNILFHIPISIGMTCFFLLCVLFVGLGGISLIHRLAFVQVVLMFAVAILIPLYFFISKGAEHIYDGIRLYHPYLLVVNNHDGLFFTVTGLLIGFGQVFADQASWQRLYMLERKKIVPTFLLSGVIWATIPLTFSSLIIVVIYTGGFHDIYSVLSGLIHKIDTLFLLILFICCALGAIVSAFSAGLHSMIGLIVGNIYPHFRPQADEKMKMRLSYAMAVLIGFISFALTVNFTPTLLDLVFFFGIIYSSMLVPFIVIVLSKKKTGTFVPLSSWLGLAAGYAVYTSVGPLGAIWISMIVSTLLVIISLSVKLIRQHLHASRECIREP